MENLVGRKKVIDFIPKHTCSLDNDGWLSILLAKVLGIANTGSDLTWTQCEPCEKCYKQDLPLFDPQQSSTYGNVPYNSSPCKALDTTSCGTDKNTCEYGYLYGDQSFTNGDLGVETLTIGSTTSR